MKAIHLLSAVLLASLSSSAFAALTAPPVRLVWTVPGQKPISSADSAQIDTLKSNVLASCVGPAIELIKQGSQTQAVKDAYKDATNLDADSKVDITVIISVDSKDPMQCNSFDQFGFDLVMHLKDFNGKTRELSATRINWAQGRSYAFYMRDNGISAATVKSGMLAMLNTLANEIRKNVKVRESAKDFSYVSSFGSNQI